MGLERTFDQQQKNSQKSKQTMTSIRSLTKLALCAVFALGFLCIAQAEEKKADATGTWAWTSPARNGGAEVKMTLKLKVEGDKVTGK